jgi:hypothetical protein
MLLLFEKEAPTLREACLQAPPVCGNACRH